MQELLDVNQFHFDIQGITEHLHTNRTRLESLRTQKRALEKWRLGRNQLHENTLLSRAEVSRRQLERLSTLVDFVFAHTAFYHKLYHAAGYQSGDITTWGDYHALPTITKTDVVDNFDLLTKHLLGDEANRYSSRTAGSSGQVMTILRDQALADHHTSLYLRFYEQMLGRERNPAEWLYEIYLAPPPYTSLMGQYPVFTVSQDCPPAAVLQHIHILKPSILWSFPSYLLRTIDLFGEDLGSLGLEAICTHSEGSTKGERRRIADAFGAPVFDEYGSEELCLIATECRLGRYHIVEDNVRVDVLNPNEDGSGEIVATGFMNSFMPFIRYRHGDIIRIEPENDSCVCGNNFRTLGAFLGRSDQLLTRKNGEIVPPDRVMGLYDRTLITSNARVLEFRIEQESADLVNLFVQPEPEFRSSNDVYQEFLLGLRELFGDPSPELRTHVVDSMPKSLSYKRRLITNKLWTTS